LIQLSRSTVSEVLSVKAGPLDTIQ
jgi:hypothetical protein